MAEGWGWGALGPTQPCCPAKGTQVTVQPLLSTLPAKLKPVLNAEPVLEALGGTRVPPGWAEA